MKKYLLSIILGSVILSSCAITKSNPTTTPVKNRIVTTTVADLKVEKNPITFAYTPTRAERRAMTRDELISTAQYNALKEHGTGDVMVNVSYSISGKRILGWTKIKKVVVTGYPASYVDIRKPNAEDRENVNVFYENDKHYEIKEQKGIAGINFKFDM